MKKLVTIFMIWFVVLGWWVLASNHRSFDTVDIIYREERGADDTLRLKSNSAFQEAINYKENYPKVLEMIKTIDFDLYTQLKAKEDWKEKKANIINDYFKTNYGHEVGHDKVITKTNGQELYRPEQIKDNKTKIIIHHTASNWDALKNTSDVKKYLQDTYTFHAHTRWWWDIGYNFIIDKRGNVYEWRAGGEWVVWAHTSLNNTESIWISLIGNFENEEPTKEAIESLILLTSELSKKYDIDVYDEIDYHKSVDESPYVKSFSNDSLAGHKDAGYTACPWENLYNVLDYVKLKTKDIINWKTLNMNDFAYSDAWEEQTTTNKPTTPAANISYERLQFINNNYWNIILQLKRDYINKNNITLSKNNISKTQWKLDLQTAKEFWNKDISVLLYDLSVNKDEYQIKCEGWCTVSFNGKTIDTDNIVVGKDPENIYLKYDNEFEVLTYLVVTPKDDVLQIINYDRKSYAWVPWNKFYWELIFTKDKITDLSSNFSNNTIVINKLPLEKYMRGIVETNDSESLEKNKLMSVISKQYAMFYMLDTNTHPNVSDSGKYNAIDDPRLFQKYVWAWLEQTLSKRYEALESTQDIYVVYDDYLPILPYFSCSGMFTYSAKDKRGWTDTPYLQTKLDLWVCDNLKFNWHWVWLSGKWAESLISSFGWTYDEVLSYYYDWVELR